MDALGPPPPPHPPSSCTTALNATTYLARPMDACSCMRANVRGDRERLSELLAAGPPVAADRSEVVLTHVQTDCAALHCTRLLVEAKMDATVDASIIDIVSDLFELRIRERDRRVRV